MGIQLSVDCCSCLTIKPKTDEGELTVIKYETKLTDKDNFMFNQQYMIPSNTGSDSLSFLEQPQIDYFNTENKTTNRSAILNLEEIPEIPSPKNSSNTFKKPEKKERSLSFTGKKLDMKNYQLFLANKRSSINSNSKVITH